MQKHVTLVDLVKSFQTRIYYSLEKFGVDTAENGPLKVYRKSVLGTGAFGKVVKVRCRWLAAAELRWTVAPACVEMGDSPRGSYLFQWWHTTKGVLWR